MAVIKEMLIESYKRTKSLTSIDPSKPGSFKEILHDDVKFSHYAESLAEGLNKADKRTFCVLAKNTRRALLENSMYQLNPYETLALPLLRVYLPKTISKDLVTVIPMDKPEIVRGFIRATFTKWNDNTEYSFPSSGTDISRGPTVGVPTAATMSIGLTTDVLAVAGLTSATAHLEKDFEITTVTDSTGSVSVSIKPDVDGNFSASVTTVGGADVLTGTIDYLNGTVTVSSNNGNIVTVGYNVTVSLEENQINPQATFKIDKLRLFAKDRQISTEWSIQMEQDIKALFNVDFQAEMVSTIGQQIVLDIDREIVTSLISASEKLAGASHQDTFDKTPEPGFTWGQKAWYENVLPIMNTLSAQVYADTNIGAANVIACNPLDAAILESLQEFSYTGTSSDDGDLGYESAVISRGKWKVLVSTVVSQGKMLMLHKPAEDVKATYIFAPYIPSVLSPYPLGAIPSLTILSRYGTQLIRANGISVLNIIKT